ALTEGDLAAPGAALPGLAAAGRGDPLGELRADDVGQHGGRPAAPILPGKIAVPALPGGIAVGGEAAGAHQSEIADRHRARVALAAIEIGEGIELLDIAEGEAGLA